MMYHQENLHRNQRATYQETKRQPSRRSQNIPSGVSVPGFNWASKFGLLAETRGGPAYEQLAGRVNMHPLNEEPPEIFPHIKKKWKIAKKEQKRVEWNMYKTACYTRLGA